MDATRALLDELMGEDRNGDRQKYARAWGLDAACHRWCSLYQHLSSEEPCYYWASCKMAGPARGICGPMCGVGRRVKRKLTDPDVCKMFIVGMCPYEEFQRTKHEVGPCPHIHDEELQAEWQVGAVAPHSPAALPDRGSAATTGQSTLVLLFLLLVSASRARSAHPAAGCRRAPCWLCPRRGQQARPRSAPGRKLGSTDSGSSGGR
jgi:hypothetical protein